MNLPGMFDVNKRLCLFDPQAHTYVVYLPHNFRQTKLTIIHSSAPDIANRVYWDAGPVWMKKYIAHHVNQAGCGENKYCVALGQAMVM
jgi:hypothetical protein